jgi:hypothetical protein
MAVSSRGEITWWLFLCKALLSGNKYIFKDNSEHSQNAHAKSEGTILFFCVQSHTEVGDTECHLFFRNLMN